MRVAWRDEARAASPLLRDCLRAAGIGPGHTVAVLAPPLPLHVALHAAAILDGWTVAPLSPKAPPEQLPDALRRRKADLLVIGPDEPTPAIDIPVLRCDAWGDPLQLPGAIGAPKAPGPAVVLLQTSGTTGPPKLVALPRDRFQAHATSAAARLACGPGSVWLAVLPLWHVGGVALLDRAIRQGSTVVFLESFDAAEARRLMDVHAVTHVSLVPAQLRRLVAFDARPPASLRCALLGGDSMPRDLLRASLEAGWPVFVTYGLTETCSQVATATPDESRRSLGTSGRPLDGMTVVVEDGELVVSGPTIGPKPLRTGDIGTVDRDGRVWVTGRQDDRITTGGEKVHPESVEAVLQGVAGVSEACVIGLPDEEWGQRVVAVLVGKPTVDVAAHCRGRLSPHEVPKEVRFAAALARTEGGKLKRAAVRAEWERYATTPV